MVLDYNPATGREYEFNLEISGDELLAYSGTLIGVGLSCAIADGPLPIGDIGCTAPAWTVAGVGALIGVGILIKDSIGDSLIFSDPKLSPNFKKPTNPPQDPPEIPDGWVEGIPDNGRGKIYRNPNNPGESIRIVPDSSPGYPDGYWVKTNPNKQPLNPSTGKPGSKPETHIPLPPSP